MYLLLVRLALYPVYSFLVLGQMVLQKAYRFELVHKIVFKYIVNGFKQLSFTLDETLDNICQSQIGFTVSKSKIL